MRSIHNNNLFKNKNNKMSSTIPTTISSETMSLYGEVKRLESLLRNSHTENSKLRKKMSKIIEKTKQKLSKSTILTPVSKSFKNEKAKFEKEKSKFEKDKVKFEKDKVNWAKKIKANQEALAVKKAKAEIVKKAKAGKAKAEIVKKAKAEIVKKEKAEIVKKEKAEIVKKAKAEKAKAKQEALVVKKAKAAEKAKAKQEALIVKKVDKKVTLVEKKSSTSLTGDARKLAQIENKKNCIKKYNELAFGENQLLLITPLKIGEIKKMIAEQKRKIRAEKKARKTQLSSEMAKIVKSN